MKKTLNEELSDIKGMMGKLNEMPAYVMGSDGPRQKQPGDKFSAFTADDFGGDDNDETSSAPDLPDHDVLANAVVYYNVAKELKNLGEIEDAKKYTRKAKQIYDRPNWSPFTDEELMDNNM
jgi:hypothetical protein